MHTHKRGRTTHEGRYIERIYIIVLQAKPNDCKNTLEYTILLFCFWFVQLTFLARDSFCPGFHATHEVNGQQEPRQRERTQEGSEPIPCASRNANSCSSFWPEPPTTTATTLARKNQFFSLAHCNCGPTKTKDTHS